MALKTRWLDRRIAHPGPYLALCLAEDEYLAAMKHCRVANPPDWIRADHAEATVHYVVNNTHGLACIVCMRGWQDRNPVEVAGLLVHESVHIWQEYAGRLGETSPGREQEAYAVQSVAQELMAEFARRMEERRASR